MSPRKNKTISDDDRELFRAAAQGVKRIQSDQVPPAKPQISTFKRQRSTSLRQQEAEFSFSDEYRAHFPEGPLRFCAPEQDPYIVKQLRRGDYAPELSLDLHGLTQVQAKRELAALMVTAQREWVMCVSVMHGFGSGVLKDRLPHWLVQHPRVRAFHQAPKEWGGDAAVLVLLNVDDMPSAI